MCWQVGYQTFNYIHHRFIRVVGTLFTPLGCLEHSNNECQSIYPVSYFLPQQWTPTILNPHGNKKIERFVKLYKLRMSYLGDERKKMGLDELGKRMGEIDDTASTANSI